MGWSNGRWEGETLVVDTTGFNDLSWFDRAGNFHSDALHVVERFTPRSADTLLYEATIEDPKVFTRPWKMSMPLYRRVEANAQLLEFRCVEFVEDLMYGHLRKQPEQVSRRRVQMKQAPCSALESSWPVSVALAWRRRAVSLGQAPAAAQRTAARPAPAQSAASKPYVPPQTAGRPAGPPGVLDQLHLRRRSNGPTT